MTSSDVPWQLDVFKIYNPKRDNGVDKNIDVFYGYHDLQSARLAAPLSKSSADITQNGNNPSAYLIDGGLWTACKESRLVMERNFRCVKWDALRKENPNPLFSMQENEKLDVPATGYFAGRNGDAHFFTVFPHKDLFILRPQNLNTIDWSFFNMDVQIGSHCHGFDGLQNITLEYNPEWGVQIDEYFSQGGVKTAAIEEYMIRMAFDACAAHTIWFVDYSLKRKHGPTAGQSTPPTTQKKVFYSKGRRLVEVDCFYPGFKDWEYIEKVDGNHIKTMGTTSMDFVSHIQDAIWDYIDEFKYLEGEAVSVGLLGCDEI